MNDGRQRCSWCEGDQLSLAYHDTEWGVPVHNDDTLFELLTLEGAQAGLSWITVLRRREGYRRAFENFDPEVVALFDDARIEAIVADPGVVRHRQKIRSVVSNARAIIDLQHHHGSFDRYVWALAASTSDEWSLEKTMSKQLAKDGLSFVGPTICRSFLQAGGMINDHTKECFRFHEIEALRSRG